MKGDTCRAAFAVRHYTPLHSPMQAYKGGFYKVFCPKRQVNDTFLPAAKEGVLPPPPAATGTGEEAAFFARAIAARSEQKISAARQTPRGGQRFSALAAAHRGRKCRQILAFINRVSCPSSLRQEMVMPPAPLPSFAFCIHAGMATP